MFRKYWIGILALIMAIVTIFVAILNPIGINNANNVIEAITVGLGWALFVIQYFYSKSERVYIAVNSLRLWLTNETTKWNFTVDFDNYTQRDPIENVWKVVSKQNRQAVKWHNDQSSVIVNMPGYTLRIFISDQQPLDGVHIETPETICVQVSNLELPYRTFRIKIENEIIPLIQDIAKIIKPSKEKYVAKVAFTSANPYFGFFVRKLELPNVVSFNCDLLETSVGGHKQIITIRKDRIEIITDNLPALQTLSKKYMALSWSGDYAS